VKTADIKRILSTRGVVGELKVLDEHRNTSSFIKFRDLDLLKSRSQIVIDDEPLNCFHVELKRSGIEVWKSGIARGYVTQNIPYKNIKLLWAKYPGNTKEATV
jgi:hypothetical protein